LAGDILVANDLHDHPESTDSLTDEVIRTMGSRQRKAIEYREFIKNCAQQFPQVIVIAGNHEHYHGKWIQSIETLRHEYGKYSNVHYLERDSVVINGYRFIGATLWTDLNRGDPMTLHAVNDMMNDYRLIRHDGLGYTKLRPAHTLHRHRDTVEYFHAILNQFKEDPTIIVGHHAPSHLSVHEMYRHEYLMNGAYYSDLSNLILDNPQIKLWFHGHMHQPFEYSIGDTPVLCNPRGYFGEESAENFTLKYVTVE
jgi:DNA repair exonuclease SbcCD nuclease subunit